MPFGFGTGAHDDGMHQGSAKKGVAGGVAALDASAIVPLTQIAGLTNTQIAAAAAIAKTKLAALDIVNADVNAAAAITGTKLEAGWQKNIAGGVAGLDASTLVPLAQIAGLTNAQISALAAIAGTKLEAGWQKDVAGGIPFLDSAGDVLIPGSILYMARTAGNNIHIMERSSGEFAFYLTRAAVNTYIGYIRVGGADKEIQHAGMKNVANGIAGLDAAAKVPLAQLDIAYGGAYRAVSQSLTEISIWYDIYLSSGSYPLYDITHSTTTNPERVGVLNAGVYCIEILIRGSTGGTITLRVMKNNTTDISVLPFSFTSDKGDSTVCVVSLAANDYVHIQALTNYAVSYINGASLVIHKLN